MRIKTVGDGPFVDMATNGGSVDIGGAAIDCQDRQEDSQVVVDIKATGGVLAEGKGDALVASIVIPPKEYEMVDSGSVGPDTGEPVMESVAIALDAGAVVVNLWPYAAVK